MDEFVSKFEALFDNHKDALVESAHGHDETIWINLCKIYGFQDKDRGPLKEYIGRQYTATRSSTKSG
jgi:hypothetical protein